MKQNIVIFDGPDNCGKTEISKAVSKITGIPYFKNDDEHKYFHADPSYFKHAIQYVDTYFFKYLKASGASVILDRAWPSEWVYSAVMGRSTDDDCLAWLDNFSAKLGVKIVIPYRTNYDVMDDYDIIKQKIYMIDSMYSNFADWTKCQVLRINVDEFKTDDYVKQVIEFIEKES